MQFALNYSPVAERLVESGAIRIDLWKCPSRPDLIHAATQSGVPCYIHFPFDAGANDFAQSDWDAAERLMEETNTAFVNVHLNARRADFPAVDRADDVRAMAWVQNRFLRNVSAMTARFGADRVIAENVIYRGADGPFLQASVAPETIDRVITETGCGLLLDTAHAQMTCFYTQTPVTDYLSALPLHALRELHITGVAQDETGKWRDSMPLTHADTTLAQSVISRIHANQLTTPHIAALEYGGVGPSYEWRTNEAVLREQTPLVRTWLLPT